MSGTWVFVIRMHTTLWRSDYTASRGGVWLLQDHECFDINTVEKRKRIKMPKIKVCFTEN
jgi:hypothetical protein